MAVYRFSIPRKMHYGFFIGFMNFIASLFDTGGPSNGETASEPAASGEASSEPETSLDSAEETSFSDPTTDRTIPKTDIGTDRTIPKT